MDTLTTIQDKGIKKQKAWKRLCYEKKLVKWGVLAARRIGRSEKQLCKPILWLFGQTGCKQEVVIALVELLGEKRESKGKPWQSNFTRY
jgi:hypothetical protein